MTTIVKKEDLELTKYYRKVKLDISEYVDKEEAEKLDLDKPIYGDEEGYFKVVDKQDDGYIVKFMNLENFRLRAVLEGNIDNEDFEIRKTFTKKIKNQDLDLDDMDNEYAEITLTRIIKELLAQYRSNGKKGIKLQKKKSVEKPAPEELPKEERAIKKLMDEPETLLGGLGGRALYEAAAGILINTQKFQETRDIIKRGTQQEITEFLLDNDIAMERFEKEFGVENPFEDGDKKKLKKFQKVLDDIVEEKDNPDKFGMLNYVSLYMTWNMFREAKGFTDFLQHNIRERIDFSVRVPDDYGEQGFKSHWLIEDQRKGEKYQTYQDLVLLRDNLIRTQENRSLLPIEEKELELINTKLDFSTKEYYKNLNKSSIERNLVAIKKPAFKDRVDKIKKLIEEEKEEIKEREDIQKPLLKKINELQNTNYDLDDLVLLNKMELGDRSTGTITYKKKVIDKSFIEGSQNYKKGKKIKITPN